MSGGPRLGYEMASRATAYRCWRAHGDVGLLDTRTPPGWKPLCAPLVSGLPRESYSSLARSVRKILEVWPLSAQHGPVTVSTRSNAFYDRFATEQGCPTSPEEPAKVLVRRAVQAHEGRRSRRSHC